jgi:hypothetical protein
MVECPDLARFLRGEIEARDFPHREHVRMAFEMLARHDFPESALHYSRALRAMTSRAGRPELFHQTVTIAFLALIAERMQAGAECDFAQFEQAHPELFQKDVLERFYPKAQLMSDAARRTFLLPQPRA